jgi:hypothetical protein
MPKIIVAALLLALSPSSYADCKSSIEKALEALNVYPGRHFPVNPDDWHVDVQCKVWPADPTKTLAAVRYPLGKTRVHRALHQNNLQVMVWDTSSGNVLQALYLNDTLLSTGLLPLTSIQLDTARYDLAPGVRAFGVRANREGVLHNNSQSITLYAIQENNLKQVLWSLSTHVSITNAEVSGHSCQSTDISRTLAIAKTSSHGFADLIVQEKKTVWTDGSPDKDCKDGKTDTSSRRYILHFDGGSYPAPPELRVYLGS